jgi:hypothetical protein
MASVSKGRLAGFMASLFRFGLEVFRIGVARLSTATIA